MFYRLRIVALKAAKYEVPINKYAAMAKRAEKEC